MLPQSDCCGWGGRASTKRASLDTSHTARVYQWALMYDLLAVSHPSTIVVCFLQVSMLVDCLWWGQRAHARFRYSLLCCVSHEPLVRARIHSGTRVNSGAATVLMFAQARLPRDGVRAGCRAPDAFVVMHWRQCTSARTPPLPASIWGSGVIFCFSI